MAQTPQVSVIGMKALLRDVKKLTGDSGALNKQMSLAGRRAAEPVAAATRSTLPQVSGRLAADVRTTASRSGAAVRMGRASIRYAGWVEFGGNRRAPHDSIRPYDSRGRFLFPAALVLGSVVARDYTAAVQTALNGFNWTSTGQDAHD